MSWNLIPLYLGGVQSATWQWFDMTQWQKTGGEDGNKDQGIQAAVLAAPGRSAHQLIYLLAGAQAPLVEGSDDSCWGSVGLRDISLPLVVKALLVQNDWIVCLHFGDYVAQFLPLTSSFYSPDTSFIYLFLLPGPLGLHSELSLGWWTWMLSTIATICECYNHSRDHPGCGVEGTVKEKAFNLWKHLYRHRWGNS